MGLWNKISYPTRLFLLTVVYVAIIVGAFFLLVDHPNPDIEAYQWIIVVLGGVAAVIGFVATRNINRLLSRLKDFAAKADRGERIYDIAPFRNDQLGSISNHIVRLYARLQDAQTELKRQHERTLRAEEDKHRLKKQLTNNLNHELKTPVAMMQACLETLVDHPDMDKEKREEFLSRSYKAAVRLGQLLDDLSTVTRMDEAPSSIVRSEVNAADLFRGIVDDLTPQAKSANMTIVTMMPESIMINGNPGLLRSMLSNLIVNAIKYSEGTTIEVSGRLLPDNRLSLIVADNGVGVAPEHLQRIFERFYRVDVGRSREVGGTGLGLSIVKNAVTLHGGEIKVANRSRGGLEFSIFLPIATKV